MKPLNLLFFLLLFTITSFAQTQLGNDIIGEAISDESGSSVSISKNGQIVAIGAHHNDGNGNNSGHVRVYKYNAGSWNQLGADIEGEAIYDNSGYSVSLSSDGSILAIGAFQNDGNGDNSGHVRVYKYNAGSWNQLGADIDGEAAEDASGVSISISGNGSIIAIGAFQNDGNGDNSGHVRIYKYKAGIWAKLGTDIDGETVGDYSGIRISLSEDGGKVAIGATFNSENGSASGHVRVYKYSTGAWSQLGADIDGEAADDICGNSISISKDGSIIAIAAAGNDGNGENAGQVRVYKFTSGAWTKLGADIDGEAADGSGSSVSLTRDGKILAIGASSNSINGKNAGRVRMYKFTKGGWSKLNTDINGEAEGDESGNAVSISGDGKIVAIGAPGNGKSTGQVRVFKQNLSVPKSK